MVYHSVEIRKFLSHYFFAKILKNFRENNAVKAVYSEMDFRKCEIVILVAKNRR